MFIDFKKSLFLMAIAPVAVSPLACGGDTAGKTEVADAADAIADAAVPKADAMPDTTFSGTLSLAEVALSTSASSPLASLGIRGPAINISFTSPADVTVAPQSGYTNNVGACRIFVYDVAAGEKAPKGSDGGAVTVAGTKGSNAASFGCAYNASADKYLCQSSDSAASGALPIGTSATPNSGPGAGTVTLTIPGADFSNETYRGMYINISGFPDDNANGKFSIIGQPAPTTLVLANRYLTSVTTAVAAGTYSTIIGAGPYPGGAAPGAPDFLDDGTNPITLTKGAATDAPAVNTTLKANGQGFALAGSSTKPYALPTDGSAATFSCAGSCGAAFGVLKGVLVFGETTDATLDPLEPTDMPPAVSKYATFQCTGIGVESMTLDSGAMALIMGTNPTRIRTSVTYGNAKIEGKNNIVVSQGVVGFTDVPQ